MSGLTSAEFEGLWERIDAEAQRSGFSHGALLSLQAFYRGLDEEDKCVVNGVLERWVASDDPRKRFDALALITDFGIRSALPALRAALAILPNNDGPEERSWGAKLHRIIHELEDKAAGK